MQPGPSDRAPPDTAPHGAEYHGTGASTRVQEGASGCTRPPSHGCGWLAARLIKRKGRGGSSIDHADAKPSLEKRRAKSHQTGHRDLALRHGNGDRNWSPRTQGSDEESWTIAHPSPREVANRRAGGAGNVDSLDPGGKRFQNVWPARDGTLRMISPKLMEILVGTLIFPSLKLRTSSQGQSI
jgi:hypothetical protein